MLNADAIENLKLALERLDAPDGGGGWLALEPLSRISGAGLDVSIDMRASTEIGAPVIVAMRRQPADELLARLTPRRRRVAELLLTGLSNKQIARALEISLGTVKDHVHAILLALGFASRNELIAAALGRT